MFFLDSRIKPLRLTISFLQGPVLSKIPVVECTFTLVLYLSSPQFLSTRTLVMRIVGYFLFMLCCDFYSTATQRQILYFLLYLITLQVTLHIHNINANIINND